MSRPQSDQLKSLDSFQRAEFLRMQRSHAAFSGKIYFLREKTQALYKKQSEDSIVFSRWGSSFYAVSTIAVSLLVFFNLLSSVEALGVTIIIFIIFSTTVLLRDMHVKHDKLLFESYILEIMRYEAGLEIMGLSELSESYGLENHDGLTMDILSSLGFHNGLLGGGFKTWPLEPAE